MPSEALSLSIATMQTAELVERTDVEPMTRPDPTVWVDDYGDFLFRYAYFRLRDEAVAEDCVQETFLSAIKSLETFGNKSNERTWLTGILKHKIVDHYRKSVREKPYDTEDSDLSSFENFFNQEGRWKDHWHDDFEPVDWRTTPEAAVQQTEFMNVLQNCLSKLPERVSAVFALREMDGMDADEICTILQLTPSNFWVIMHRARMGLRRCMELNWFKKAYK